MRVIDIIGTKTAISPRAGLLAYEYIATEVKNKHAISVSFEGIQDLTSAFCNAFIGKLYMNFDTDSLNALLQINGIDSEVWQSKIATAIMLGSSEHARTNHNISLGDILRD